MSSEDGSSVHAKVAQYFVNRKHRELESKNAQIRVGDWDRLQALPQYEPNELDRGIDNSTQHDTTEPPQLPPLIPIGTDDGSVSWKDLLHKVPRPPGPDTPTTEPSFPPRFPSWYRVAIIGAGVAGLRSAKLLQDLGIPYKIFEASDRPGGRIYTQQFSSKPNDYYDVGAMRFPDNDANKKTFELFKELNLKTKMIDYILSRDNNIRSFNNINTTAAVANTVGDHFDDEIVPDEYLNKTHEDWLEHKTYGVNACVAAAYEPHRKALINDFDKGWQELMRYDWASTRSYLTQEKPKYPLPVVHWMETRTSGTGGYDRGFSEAILDSLVFNDPTKDVKWWALQGGSQVLIDAMLGQLDKDKKPFYGHRVTAVEQVYLTPYECFPGLPWGRWRRFPLMKVSVEGKGDEFFGHVISTTTFGNLGTIDTDRVPMTYLQRQAIRTLNYGPAVKVGIKFKTRWWEEPDLDQCGGSSSTDRQSRVVVYPSYGRGDKDTGVLMATYNWHQDASRYGSLIKNPEIGEIPDPNRKIPPSEKVLLDQIYGDLAKLHGKDVEWLKNERLNHHAFNWYQDPFSMGAFAHFAPGQYSMFLADITQPAAYGRFHFAGEVASHHHAWVAGALDSAVRAVGEIFLWDFLDWYPWYRNRHGWSSVFCDGKTAEDHFFRGLFSKELEEAGY